MSDNTVEKETTVYKKDFKLFGKSISEITCFRNSFICGICTGVATGLITFLFTSKANVSSHCAFGSLWVGVFAYWIPCRYKYESNLLMAEEWKKTQKALRREMREKREKEEKEESKETSIPSSEK